MRPFFRCTSPAPVASHTLPSAVVLMSEITPVGSPSPTVSTPNRPFFSVIAPSPSVPIQSVPSGASVMHVRNSWGSPSRAV